MDKQKFVDMIDFLKKISDDYTKLSELKVDLIAFTDPFHHVISLLMEDCFGQNGREAVVWYCYENDFGRNGLEMHDDDGVQLCKNPEGLYDYVVSINNPGDAKTTPASILKASRLYSEMSSLLEPKDAVRFIERWVDVFESLVKDMENRYRIGAFEERAGLMKIIYRLSKKQNTI